MLDGGARRRDRALTAQSRSSASSWLLCAAMVGGTDRAELAAMVGYDVTPYLQQARAAVDESLSAFGTADGDLRLADSTTASSFLAGASATLADQRSRLDEDCANEALVVRTLQSVLDVADEIHRERGGLRRHHGRRRVRLLPAWADGPAERCGSWRSPARPRRPWRRRADAVQRPPRGHASGVADYVLSLYDVVVRQAPERFPAWSACSRPRRPPRSSTARSTSSSTRSLADQLPNPADIAGGRDAVIRARGHVMLLAVQRMDEFTEYARREFEIGRAAAVAAAADADASWNRQAIVLVVGTLLLAVFLLGTIVMIVVPLRRLVVQGRRFVHGESGLALTVAGPSDIREVTETFNWLTATVASFEHELASGSGISGPIDPRRDARLARRLPAHLRLAPRQPVTAADPQTLKRSRRRSSRPPPTRTGNASTTTTTSCRRTRPRSGRWPAPRSPGRQSPTVVARRAFEWGGPRWRDRSGPLQRHGVAPVRVAQHRAGGHRTR